MLNKWMPMLSKKTRAKIRGRFKHRYSYRYKINKWVIVFSHSRVYTDDHYKLLAFVVPYHKY